MRVRARSVSLSLSSTEHTVRHTVWHTIGQAVAYTHRQVGTRMCIQRGACDGIQRHKHTQTSTEHTQTSTSWGSSAHMLARRRRRRRRRRKGDPQNEAIAPSACMRTYTYIHTYPYMLKVRPLYACTYTCTYVHRCGRGLLCFSRAEAISLSLSLSLPPSLSVKQRGGLIKASGPHVSSAPLVEVNIHR